ncbi:CoA-acylating methylmalonate-semialdehyde dehydrogenase [Thioalbus denitrificans]|uniref:methylmalonate-semialdehyde dehydrogenase (CoA acylating) n=1 Tax=Thioalbus denitrificans TaxID=547122 RepID=A0A369CFB8_9GAMM|nr:CoA-acylating methylmalonate-semialdehyde dehydrogenase [Thioalbus denitrificans]RCX31805.1 malonate-semialdehyde dehydrogenase (acetylating)/methylmalonate-semialdehyde dehydrogenase [Thioalbus denitrificans]
MAGTLPNFIGGRWETPAAETAEVHDPATQALLARVPLCGPAEVDAAVRAAASAFGDWRRTPATERVQFLFRLKVLLEAHRDDIARTITRECGKTLAESHGELQRAIENVEVACGIPTLMQGRNLEDIARGIDEHLIRQPLGVVGIIAPFNFPAMIPFWFLPYAIATGNSVVVKPSERVPATMQKLMALVQETGLPDGVVNLVNGGAAAVDALLDHPDVRAVSFVGSTPVARHVYSRGTAAGKRVQAQGGAKNPVVIMPDADPELTTAIVADSAFGCAGQRCLAASLLITVGSARERFLDALGEAAATRRVGYGLEDDTQMGPVITPASRVRIEGHIERAVASGARVLVDGRGQRLADYPHGNFIGPTLLDGVRPDDPLVGTEVFGPVLGLLHADSLETAIGLVNRGAYGNMACLFTESGAAARRFRHEVEAGNVGINIGVAAPMAFFPFSGWKESFFGDLHAQGSHALEFYTQTKVVVERWPREWSRTF